MQTGNDPILQEPKNGAVVSQYNNFQSVGLGKKTQGIYSTDKQLELMKCIR
jgi:hypothetical protein